MSPLRKNVLTGILIFIGIVLVCALGVAFWYIRVVFLYIIVAAILTMITRPLEKRLERVRIRKKKIPRSLRALSILLGIYLVIFAFIAIFIPVIADEANIISKIDSKQLATALQEPIADLENTFAAFQPPDSVHVTGSNLQDSVVLQPDTGAHALEKYVQASASKLLNVAQVSSLANSLVSFVSQIFVAFFVISFFTFLFIKDGPVIFEILLLLIPPKHIKSVRNIISDTQLMLSKYFTGVLIDIIFVATFISSGMAILGVRNALIIGIFAGVMNIIPYIGPLIGGAFAMIIAISTNLTMDFHDGLMPLLVKIFFVFLAMNLTDGFLVQPYIFSKRVRAHPIEIFTVILVAGSLVGIGGMIVAVPLYTMIRIMAREFMSKHRFVQRLTDELEDATENDKTSN